MLKLGDIVQRKGATKNDLERFIVTDIFDFTTKGSKKKEYLYEVARIFPLMERTKVFNMDEEDLKILVEFNSDGWEHSMSYISRERKKRGWDKTDKPDFQKLLIASLSNEDKSVKLPIRDLDVVRYDLLESVDECLDAMNDLDKLHKQFGDESYLQLKELVVTRLKEIV